jgi:hypothetical protein
MSAPAAAIAAQRVAEVRDSPQERLEHTVGRLLDLGVVVPRLTELYCWSADELRIPDLTDLVRGATPTYAWDPLDWEPWAPPATRLVRAVRRALPSPRRAPKAAG